MIGIKFKVRNEYNNFLYRILEGINFDKCKWEIIEEEIYNEKGENFFQKSHYLNQPFEELIKNNMYYIVFANIQLYNIKSFVSKITDYEDFVKSDCMLILFVTDNEFVEIYGKNPKILKKILKNVKNNKFFNIEVVNEEKEIKKIFSAYTD